MTDPFRLPPGGVHVYWRDAIGGTVLDPFLGSGSTALAADQEGFHCIGVDLSAEYLDIARRRIAGDAPLFNMGA